MCPISSNYDTFSTAYNINIHVLTYIYFPDVLIPTITTWNNESSFYQDIWRVIINIQGDYKKDFALVFLFILYTVQLIFYTFE